MRRFPITILLLLAFPSQFWFPAPISADEPVLVSDDFSSLSPAWGPADDVMSAGKGKLTLNLKENGAYRVFYGKESLGNVDIRVKASLVKGGVDRAGGIVFWGSSESFYVARFYTDGYVGVTRSTRGKWLPVVPNRVLPEITQGLGVVNELRVMTSGDRATMYVNGKEVIAFKGFPPEGGGKVGLFGDSTAEPYEWAFSDFSIRKGPAPKDTGPRDAGLLFADDFSTLDPAWGGADKVQSVADHKLVMAVQPGTTYTALYRGNLFDDADIRTQLSLEQGGVDKAAGIVFWAAADTNNNYYVASLYSDGNCGIVRCAQGMSEQVVPPKLHHAVRKGAGQVNELRVVTKGDSVTFYINLLPVAAMKGSPPEGGSRIGLQAGAADEPYRWTFANLAVRKQSAPHKAKPDPAALFTDDFSTINPKWSDESASVHDNHFILTATPGRTAARFYERKFSDIEARVTLTSIVGNAEGHAAGMTFWGTPNSFYMARLHANGKIGVARRTRDTTLSPVEDRPHEAVKKGLGATNELRVVTSGNLATIFVNGQQAFAFKGHPPARESLIGLGAEAGDESSIWAFSDLKVFQGPAPPKTEPADPTLLYTDNFRTLDSAWGLADEYQRVANGKFVLTPAANKPYMRLYHSELYDDIDLRVKISQTKGDPKERAGVVFWSRGTSDLYVYLFSADNGSILRNRKVAGDWTGSNTFLKLGAANQGLGKVNELRIVTSGKMVKLYLNDKLMDEFESDPPKNGSLIGFYGESGKEPCTYEFSNLSVRKP